jgi:hypothetical protein
MAVVSLDTANINDWDSFHAESAKVFGFPAFYGKNLNAWIDCLTYLQDGDGLSSFTLKPGEVLTIVLPNYKHFAESQPEICLALGRSVAAVNHRYLAAGDIARLVLMPQ